MGVDPEDARGLENELDALVLRLTGDMSKLAMVKLLPRAKTIYETLHPETRHGGVRGEQVEKITTCPSFVTYMGSQAGVSSFTVYAMLDQAEALKGLDAQAEAASYGTPLANKLSLLVRIGRLPKKEVQREVVAIYQSAGPKKGKDELAKWEAEFKLAPAKATPVKNCDPAVQLLVLIAKVADPVTATQDFTHGMPLPQLWKMLGPLVEMYARSGSVPPEALKDIIVLRDLRIRLAKLKALVAKNIDVAPTAAKQFAVCDTTLDAAINNPRLTPAHVERLEHLWEQAVAHVHERKVEGHKGEEPKAQERKTGLGQPEPKMTPIEQVLGTPKPTTKEVPKANPTPTTEGTTMDDAGSTGGATGAKSAEVETKAGASDDHSEAAGSKDDAASDEASKTQEPGPVADPVPLLLRQLHQHHLLDDNDVATLGTLWLTHPNSTTLRAIIEAVPKILANPAVTEMDDAGRTKFRAALAARIRELRTAPAVAASPDILQTIRDGARSVC